MVILRRFSPSDDLPMLASWLKGRDLPTDFLDTLPAVGYVVHTSNSLGVAAGFIRQVEGGYGMLDGYLTNPDVPPEIRHEALDALTAALLEEAKQLGISQLFAFSVDKNTIVRSQRHGFQQLGHVVIAAKLSR